RPPGLGDRRPSQDRRHRGERGSPQRPPTSRRLRAAALRGQGRQGGGGRAIRAQDRGGVIGRERSVRFRPFQNVRQRRVTQRQDRRACFQGAAMIFQERGREL